MLKEKQNEKEQAEKMKALRKELEEKLEEQLPAEMQVDEPTRVEVQRIDENQPLPQDQAKRVIEALLFAATKPLTPAEIRKVMKFLSLKEIEGLVSEIRADFIRDNRSFEVVDVAGGYEIATKKEFAPWIFKIELQKKARQVTQSALETLSIMAYKQPITRAEIEDLRGVDAGGVLNTLMERSLVKIVGKKEVPGRPFLYGTTEKFLEHFGLKSLQELPNIEEIKVLLERSVKKEELIGKKNIVDIPQDGTSAETPVDLMTGNPEPSAEINAAEEASQSEENNESEPSQN